MNDNDEVRYTFARARLNNGFQPVPIVERERRSPFIHKFKGAEDGIVCPSFWVLAHANLCPFLCSYCYLQNTFRNQDTTVPVLYTNLDRMEANVRNWLVDDRHNGPAVLNAGEICDGLVFDEHTGLSRRLVPIFAAQERHYLLFLTKSVGTRAFEWGGIRPPTPQVILSFSLNAPAVAEAFERFAPTPYERALAANRCDSAGWRVRFRFDPLIPIPRWQWEYEDFIRVLAALGCRPERITLGSLRYKVGVRRKAAQGRRPGFEVFDFATERTEADGRFRVPAKLRVEMYTKVIEWIDQYLRPINPGLEVGLCKETVEVREALGFGPESLMCNCTP